MILYNVTISIDPQVSSEWLEWMRSEHIPEVLATNCFTESRISRVNGEEEGGETYSVMYFAASKELYDEYNLKFAPELQHKHTKKFQGKFAAFRTVLDVIEEFKL
jgi:hypothetical protein